MIEQIGKIFLDIKGMILNLLVDDQYGHIYRKGNIPTSTHKLNIGSNRSWILTIGHDRGIYIYTYNPYSFYQNPIYDWFSHSIGISTFNLWGYKWISDSLWLIDNSSYSLVGYDARSSLLAPLCSGCVLVDKGL